MADQNDNVNPEAATATAPPTPTHKQIMVRLPIGLYDRMSQDAAGKAFSRYVLDILTLAAAKGLDDEAVRAAYKSGTLKR